VAAVNSVSYPTAVAALHLEKGANEMNRKLTETQRAEYLETAQHVQRCPFCKSEEIDSTAGFDGTMQSFACHECKREWIDYYTLTGIEEMDSGQPELCIKITVKGG
jgi:transposase-like protein